MTPECIHTLPNGRKCRGLAGHRQPLCRHHRPKTDGPPPISQRDRYSALARWRATGRELPYLRAQELPSLVYELLDALTQPGQAPSDRTVGRFLRAALTRLGEVPFPYPHNEPAPPPASLPPTRPAQSCYPSAPAAQSAAHHAFAHANPNDLAQLQREMSTLFATLEEAQRG
jgi:hypothetical protein